MLRTAFWYGVGWSYLILTSPLMLIAKFFDMQKRYAARDIFVGRFTRHLARVLFYLTGSSLKITGMENVPRDQPVLFISNHQGHLDNAVIHGFIDVQKGFFSIVEARKIPILSSWMSHMQCVFLDRGNLKQTAGCINQGIKLLKSGHSMIIFPEGKLSDSDTVGEFKGNCTRIAAKAGVSIIPISLKNTYKAISKDGSKIRPAAVECIISSAIPTKNLEKGDSEKLSCEIREIIIKNSL